MRPKRWHRVLLIGAIAAGLSPAAIAQEAGATGLARTVPAPATIQAPRTLALGPDELVNAATGIPDDAAFPRHGGDIEAYWAAARTARVGKALEAVFASTENARLAATGSGRRVVVLAAEGMPSSTADLAVIDRSGKVIRRIQAKMGWENARRAVGDSRYHGMDILTDQESLDTLRRELARAEEKAARRGLPLSGDWRLVRRALDEGRILQRTPSGAPLLTRAHVEGRARAALQQVWDRLASGARRTAPLRAAAGETGEVLAKAAGAPHDAARAAGPIGLRVARGVVVVGVALDAGLRVKDGIETERRFASGELTEQEREIRHVNNAAGFAGGLTGACVGAKAGGAAGAAVGAAFGGVGAPVGAAVGATAGAVTGYLGGEKALSAAAEFAVGRLHGAGTTIRREVDRAAGWVHGSACRVWKAIW